MVASSFKLPAPLKAVLTSHYGCLLKTRREAKWSAAVQREEPSADTNTDAGTKERRAHACAKHTEVV